MKTSIWVLLAGLSTAGCTSLNKQRVRADHFLEEESRALTTAVVECLEASPPGGRDAGAELALAFARQDQRIEGLPTRPFDTLALIGANHPFTAPRSEADLRAARQDAASRFSRQNSAIERRAQLTGKLVERGITYESERNSRIMGWMKRLGLFGSVAAIVVILCIIFPVLLPVFGRILAWVVAKVPSVAGWIGVVGVNAFDAIVKGVEKTKNTPAGRRASLSNEAMIRSEALAGPVEAVREDERGALAELHGNLSSAMDAAHKQLVRKRKAALAL